MEGESRKGGCFPFKWLLWVRYGFDGFG